MRKINKRGAVISLSMLVILFVMLIFVSNIAQNTLSIKEKALTYQSTNDQLNQVTDQIKNLERKMNEFQIVQDVAFPTVLPIKVDNTDDNIKEDEPPLRTLNTNIYEASGLTTEELNELLVYVLTSKFDKTNSKLLGQGQTLKYVEDVYKVNALFTLSVSCLESGWGCEGTTSINNLFGFYVNNKYRTYKTPDASIFDFGNTMRRLYFDNQLTTIKSISRIYCPPRKDQWAKDVTWMMKFFTKIASDILQN